MSVGICPVRRTELFAWFFFARFSKTYAGATAVLVNELDAGGFQCAANSEVVRCRHGCLVIAQFSAADRGHANRRFPREILSAPPNERPSRSDLGAG
jgi:hypothetical protein